MQTISFKLPSGRTGKDYRVDSDSDAIGVLSGNDGKIVSGRLGEKWMNSRPLLKDWLLRRFSDTLVKECYNPFPEIVYRIVHKIEKRPVCPTCGSPVSFIDTTVGFREFCSNLCVNRYEGTKEKIKKTCLEKFGYTNALKSPEIKKKMEATNLKRYGVKNVYQSEEVKKKIRETNLEKYGVESPMQSREIMDKSKKTCIERYGADRPYKNEKIVEKGKKTCLEKYGYESPFKSPEIRKRIEETNLKKYGARYATELPEYQAKQRATNLKKFGAEYYIQSEEGRKRFEETWNSEEFKNSIAERMRKSTHSRYKNTAGERLIYQALCLIFPKESIVQQYRSSEYPFICDFYLKGQDVYIEYQGSQYHQNHMYTGSREDIQIIEEYKKRNLEFGTSVEENWKTKDLHKRDVCIQNNVKMLFLYPGITSNWKSLIDRERKHVTRQEELEEFSKVLETYIKECKGFKAVGEI